MRLAFCGAPLPPAARGDAGRHVSLAESSRLAARALLRARRRRQADGDAARPRWAAEPPPAPRPVFALHGAPASDSEEADRMDSIKAGLAAAHTATVVYDGLRLLATAAVSDEAVRAALDLDSTASFVYGVAGLALGFEF
eukprot:tig00000204_g17746.t1